MSAAGSPLAPLAARLAQATAELAAGRHAAACGSIVLVLKQHREELSRAANPAAVGAEALRDFADRLVAAWCALVQAPGWNPLREPALPALLCELGEFYLLAGHVADDRLDRALAAQAGRFNRGRDAVDFLRVLLLWTPESRGGFSPFAHFASARAVVVAHALATIASLVNCSEAAHAARRAAIALLDSGAVTVDDLQPFVPAPVFPSAWFRCSYSDVPDRHAIKRLLNAAIVRVLEREAGSAPPPRPFAVGQAAGDGRPRLVVPVEWAFSEGGAMYRCYAPVLRDLRRHFYTIGLCEQRIAHPSLAALFDRHATFESLCGERVDTGTLAAAIRAMQPAMVFYPSVGMLRTVIGLANLRLAPVQAMSVGHPASSMSAAMDYVITESAYVGDPAIFSEQALLVSPGAMTFGAPPLLAPVGAMPDAAQVHVAVPAVGHKVGWPLLSALREVAQRARRPLLFHFFTGLGGTTFLEFSQQAHRVLPAARFYPVSDYDRYLDAIRGCHLHAASFPFGGTNSVIDSLRLGLPVVALEGREVHERVDAAFMRLIGLDELVATSVAGYVDILVALVDDPDRVLALRRRILDEGRVASELMGPGRPREFSDALAALLRTPAGT